MTAISLPGLDGARAAHKRRQRARGAVFGVLSWIAVVVFTAPALWTLIISFRTESAAASADFTLLAPFTLEAYQKVFGTSTGQSVWGPLLNSVGASFGSTLIVLLLAIPAAYALSIDPIKKSSDVLFFLLSTKFMPVVAAILPQYLFAVAAQLIDSRAWLMLLYVIFNLPIAIWLIQSFMMEIPVEMVEAAQIDGASRFTIITRVVCPVIMPGIAAAGLICVIFSWNELLIARTMSGATSLTSPVFLTGFVTTQGQFLAQLSAVSVVVSLPILILGLSAQRQLVSGLSLGAVK